MTCKTSFIAETGPSGEVIWVWRYDDGAHNAVPVQGSRPDRDDLQRACFYGARPEEIRRWLCTADGGTRFE